MQSNTNHPISSGSAETSPTGTLAHRDGWLGVEQFHRYAMASQLAGNKRVLDIACGDGRGAGFLAGVATEVTGVDERLKKIATAKRNYRGANLKFLHGSHADIPVENHSVELLVSFDTIEHIRDPRLFLKELKRVLVPGGVLVTSALDRTEYYRGVEQPNPLHKTELDEAEFTRLLGGMFKHCSFAKQRLVAGSWMTPKEGLAERSLWTYRPSGDAVEVESGAIGGLYTIAVCSNRPLPPLRFGLFEDGDYSADVWDLLEHYDTPANIMTCLAAHDAQVRQLEERLARQTSDLLDAQWEVMTARSTIVGELKNGASASERIRDLEEDLEIAATERDQLRDMLKSLQLELEKLRAQERAAETAALAARNADSSAEAAPEVPESARSGKRTRVPRKTGSSSTGKTTDRGNA